MTPGLMAGRPRGPISPASWQRMQEDSRTRLVDLPPGTPDTIAARRAKLAALDMVERELARLGRAPLTLGQRRTLGRVELMEMYHQLKKEGIGYRALGIGESQEGT